MCYQSYQVLMVPAYVSPVVTESYLGLPLATCVTRVTLGYLWLPMLPELPGTDGVCTCFMIGP